MLGGLSVGLLVAVLLVAWRLASGPVSISFLTPYIEQALAEVHQGAVNLAVDDTILTWAGWERTLDIRIVNLRTTLPDGQAIATVPEVSISLSAEALLQGVVAPRSVEFFGPQFRLVRDERGRFETRFLGSEEGSGNFVASMVLLLLQDPNPGQAMSFLKRISIVAADISYEDRALGTTWKAPGANAQFSRVAGGIEAELDLGIELGQKRAEVSILGRYSRARQRADLGVSFDDVTPADFAALSPTMEALTALDVPLSGTVTLSMKQNGAVEGVGFDLSGGAGAVALPVPLAAKLGALAWAQRLDVDSLQIRGRYDGDGQVVDFSKLDVAFKKGESLYLPAPLEHVLPIDFLNAALTYEGAAGRLQVSSLDVGLAGSLPARAPAINLSADIGGLDDATGGVSVDLTGSVRGLTAADLALYWPESLGANARTWVIANVRDGVVQKASVSVALRPGKGGQTRLASLAGDLAVEGLTVDYLTPLPPVTNAAGRATFTDKRFDIQIESGDGADGLKVMGGTVALLKLDQKMSEAEVELDILGPVRSALTLIDGPPLGFAADIGIKPQDAAGTVAAQVSLKFPLKVDLLATEVTAQAQARLTGASIKNGLFQKNLVNGDLALAVNNDALELKGAAQLGGVPVQLVWNHDFREQALFRDRYDISGSIRDVLGLGVLGVQVPEILSRYMAGGAEANVNYTRLADGRQSVSARVDLSKITLAVPELGWLKPVGVPGTAVLEFRLKDDVPQDLPRFEVSAPDMDISGNARFFANGQLQRIDLDTMRSGNTDVSGSLTPLSDGGWELVLRGERLDARLLWERMLGIRPDQRPGQTADQTAVKINTKDLKLSVAVDLRTLMIRKDRELTDLIGTLYRDRGEWRKIDITGVVGDGDKDPGGALELLLDTDTDGLRYLSIASDDAGAALRSLDLYDNILGGRLDLKAAYTTPAPNAPLQGVLKVEDYAMINAPMFAKLIGVMSLTGVLDALQGEGLNFDIFDAPFKLEGGVLELTDSRASGPTIGVTASGTVDLGKKQIKMEGTVVPAYAINALLGKIPIIGELFSGPEKGGGLFAATYTMKGTVENTEININPLSALAPGALRGIFTGSKKEQEIPGQEAPSAPAAPPAAPAPVQ